MKCEKCGKYTANVMFKTNINGNKNKQYLCEKCAKDIKMPKFNDMIEEMLNFEMIGNNILSDLNFNSCPKCGTLYMDFINGKNDGCLNCNDIFWPRFRKTLGSNHNIGKEKIKEESKENIINNLQKKLEKAIEEERYEDCAKIRDEIKEKSKK